MDSLYATGSIRNDALYLLEPSVHVHDHVWGTNGKRNSNTNMYE
jgi:hypothetical protein